MGFNKKKEIYQTIQQDPIEIIKPEEQGKTAAVSGWAGLTGGWIWWVGLSG